MKTDSLAYDYAVMRKIINKEMNFLTYQKIK